MLFARRWIGFASFPYAFWMFNIRPTPNESGLSGSGQHFLHDVPNRKEQVCDNLPDFNACLPIEGSNMGR